jgi:hypothetical protein
MARKSPQQELHMTQAQAITRRHFLGKMSASFGGVALAGLLNDALFASTDERGRTVPHFKPRAKRVIYLHMAGSPSQHDLLDYKPKLNKHNMEPAPKSLYEDAQLAFIEGRPNLLGSPYSFSQYGQNGLWVSELLPHFTSIVDDVCVIRSMYTDEFNHAPAQLFLYTGSPRFGRPSMGSWVTYGLGSENNNLPSFVVLASGGKSPAAGNAAWGSGFLPSVHQGVQCRSEGDPVLYASNPKGMDREMRQRSIDALNEVNRQHAQDFGDPETLTRIQQYELAFRMQASVPGTMDISNEPQHILDMYGAEPGKASLANNCLLARRLAESDVRFIQLFDWGWDSHGTGKNDDLMHSLPSKCKQMDRPVTALVKDLKQRGMLEDTLVVWSGEFGRTAMNEARNGSKFLGRDHHPDCFTIWMAGGGTRPGAVIGQTDDFGYKITKDPVHIHDLQATILHLMGIDHKKLTYKHQGRDFRLTDVHGHVVKKALA